jgi:hypothetical protein
VCTVISMRANVVLQLDYYMAQEARRQQEFHDKMPRSLSAGQCAPEAIRDNEFLRYRPNTVQVDASKKSSPDRVTTSAYVNKNLPANNPTATSTPRQAVPARIQQHHEAPDSGIHSAPYSTGGSTSSQSSLGGRTYTCLICDAEYNDRQKFDEHCLKCVIE